MSTDASTAPPAGETQSARSLREQGYAVLPSLVEDPLLGFLWRHLRAAAEVAGQGDELLPQGLSLYADVVMEHLLKRLQPALESSIGLALYPTYSYCRLYRHGESLARHADRRACEFSMSINLGQEPAAPWPLWVNSPKGPVAINAGPGDAVVYRGMHFEHWREPYAGSRLGQVFLHYVAQEGPCAKFRFDEREGLNLSIPLPI